MMTQFEVVSMWDYEKHEERCMLIHRRFVNGSVEIIPLKWL